MMQGYKEEEMIIEGLTSTNSRGMQHSLTLSPHRTRSDYTPTAVEDHSD